MLGIRDVAKYAKVSTSTVSIVLNNNGYVSEDTRKKVMDAVEKLNYVPNELARNLYHNRTNIIGLILPDVAHPFFGTFAKFVEQNLYQYGYKVMLCSTVQEKNGEKEYINMLKRQMLDGIIVGTHTIEMDVYNNVEKPIVSLDRYINEEIPIVRSDHEKGGCMAAEELIRNGCKKILQLKGSKLVNTPAHLHHIYFEKELLERGALVYTEEMPWNKWDFETYKAFSKECFLKYKNIDAVYGADMVVAAYLKVALENHIEIPKELKLIAYDGTFVTQMNSLTITSIKQNIQELAMKSVRLLLDQMEGKPIEKTKNIVDVSLEKGDTTL